MSEPSKEALAAAREWLLSPGGMHEENVQSLAVLLDTWADRYFAAGEAHGLEGAAAATKDRADKLFNWMVQFDLGSPERIEKSLRAGEIYEVEAAIRALKPEGRPR